MTILWESEPMIVGIYSFHPFPQPIFGQTVRMMNILKYLSQSNKVIVYSPDISDTENPAWIRRKTRVRTVATRKFGFQLTYRYALLNDINVYRFLKKESDSFDVLQLENSPGTSIVMRRCKIPKVGVFHSAGLRELSWKIRDSLVQGNIKEYVGWSFYRFYSLECEKTLARKSKSLIVTSESVRDYAASLGADPNKISVLRNGVDLEEYQRYSNSVSKHELRRNLGIPHDAYVFIFHGSFYFDQNIAAIENIIRISRKLSARLRNFHYVIVGGPVERLKKAWRENVSNVLFTGYVEDVKPYLFSADCGLAPYPEDAVSGGRLKIVEYLAAGLPVVATRTGVCGFEQLVDDEPIYVLERLRDIEKLLPLPHIDVNMGKLKNFDWSRVAAANEKILKEALEQSS